MLTQCLDERNWLLGFITRWVDELAHCVDALDVIALERGAYAPPPNVRVYSLGKERGQGRLGLLLGFYRALFPLIRRADVIFVHMIPRYAVLAAPLAWLFRKPLALWYVHPHVGLELRLAAACAWRVFTAADGSFPLATSKLRVLGHGIDADFFSPGDCAPTERPAIVHVGRLMSVKNQAALLRALAAIAHETDAQAVFVGDVPPGYDLRYLDLLRALAAELDIADRVIFTGALPAREVRDWYRRAAVAVNLTRAGFFDKAALESMAVGAPTIVGNALFDALLGEYTPQLRLDSPDDVDGLAARLLALFRQPQAERAQMTAAIRERVIAAHSLTRLMSRLARALETGETDDP